MNTRKENDHTLRIAIEAQIRAGAEGGIEQVLIGLFYGLRQPPRAQDERYVVVGPWRGGEWLLPHTRPVLEYIDSPAPRGQFLENIKNLLGPLRPPLGVMRRALKSPILGKQEYLSSFEIPASGGLYEAIGADVLHITYPLNFVRSSVPTVITMHDLQHRHLPELFPLDVMRLRECTYPQMFRLSRAIITVSRFCKEDIVKQYGVPASKIYVIPLAAPIEVYARPSAETKRIVINKYKLPQDFMLYPAMTYEHKNHVRLLQAIALLRAEGIKASLVCTGAQFHHWPVIRQTISELRLESSVQFLGFVDASDLTALYELAQFIVLPSLFEGAGLPLLEAFKASRAVACSDIAAFREYGGDAPLFFDARAPRSIADAIRMMVGNADLRVTLAARGARQGAQYNWSRTAGLHRAVYRKVAGLELSSEENQLLSVA